jgi:hypothetical protein
LSLWRREVKPQMEYEDIYPPIHGDKTIRGPREKARQVRVWQARRIEHLKAKHDRLLLGEPEPSEFFARERRLAALKRKGEQYQ